MAKQTSKSLTVWDKQLADAAKKASAVEKNVGTGNFVGTAGGQLKYHGAVMPGNKMEVIILKHILENDMFQGKYDPSNPQPPACYALGDDPDSMKPHEAVEKPFSDECSTCENNEWGSADQGRGKACKEVRRLAIIPSNVLESADAIRKVEVAFLRPPVTSVKGWAGYVRELDDTHNVPPYGVITEISLVPDAKNQFAVVFRMVEKVKGNQDIYTALLEKIEKVDKEIYQPYVQIQAAPARQPAKGKRYAPPVKAAAAGRTTARR